MARRRRRSKKAKKDEAAGGALLVAAVGIFWIGSWIASLSLWVSIPLGVLVITAAVLIIKAVHDRNRKRTLALQDLRALSPRELELHVAQVISALPGWRADATRGSSDQGADVIAVSPRGARVAIQVKHYTGNVGNAAVQEIVASKALYRCVHAAVVTSGPGYTRAAQELARANSVVLWGPEALFQLQAAAQAGTAPSPAVLPG
ncbi:restriction endonuclease [Deinococcus budaensis]|uniref:HJR/Mrr/RecB family endonuclease n=1 Tax=Deinococcus budaensis TaxID=1665626 RepID=A0A7W8GF61_9DEIO|nr:restriction endonuclease [Deinococcus budaensis]MBB5234506.1 HJR/Mrr/RecB family endonuclease [Deinococcus budaensis]